MIRTKFNILKPFKKIGKISEKRREYKIKVAPGGAR
jgi:hypothetical protein